MEASAFALLVLLAISLYISSFRWAALVQFIAITVALGVPSEHSQTAGMLVLTCLIVTLFAVSNDHDSDVYPALLLALCSGILVDHSVAKHGQ